jgi:ribosomal protein S27AE
VVNVSWHRSSTNGGVIRILMQHPRLGCYMNEVIVSSVYDGKRRTLYLHKCIRCSGEFYAPKHINRKYCGKDCSREANKEIRVVIVCDLCGIDFFRSKSSLKKSKTDLHFCSRECKDTAQRIENYASVLRPSNHKDGRSSYRAIAFRHYPAKCNRCEYDKHVGILRVHHRNRNRTNNDPSNLEILCPNCHEVEHLLAKDGIYWKKKLMGP